MYGIVVGARQQIRTFEPIRVSRLRPSRRATVDRDGRAGSRFENPAHLPSPEKTGCSSSQCRAEGLSRPDGQFPDEVLTEDVARIKVGKAPIQTPVFGIQKSRAAGSTRVGSVGDCGTGVDRL